MTRPTFVQCCGITGRRASLRGARRAGYTLFELIVVVAVIAVVGAIAIPSMFGIFADTRLSASGDMIRARMADARSMAMEQGVSFRFGFVPGTGKFQIAADDSPLWDTVEDSGPVEDDEHIRGELLEEILFAADMDSLSGSDGPSPGGAWEFGGVFLPDGTARGAANPDGTTSDDVTFYFGKAGFSPLAVTLRGLTGALRVFDPLLEGNQP